MAWSGRRRATSTGRAPRAVSPPVTTAAAPATTVPAAPPVTVAAVPRPGAGQRGTQAHPGGGGEADQGSGRAHPGQRELHDPGRRLQGQGQRRLPWSRASRTRGSPPTSVSPEGEGLFNVRVGNFAARAGRRARSRAAPRRREVQAVHSQAVSFGGSPAPLRLPPWARKGSPLAPAARPLRVLLREERLVTVCEEARCPNLAECFSRGTATFMLLGDRCTRRCGYCAVAHRPAPAARPGRAGARGRCGGASPPALRRADRGGARRPPRTAAPRQFAATVHAVRARLPEAQVEVLTPDFKGDRAVAAPPCSPPAPDVFNHNVEMAPRLFPALRPQGDYARSLDAAARRPRAAARAR